MRGPGSWYVTGMCGLAGVFHVSAGIWAFVAPRSFYDALATFPPYNIHFLHDLGAFMIGIGAALLAALRWPDALFVVLVGGTTAAILHWVSHLRDHHLGGLASDPWLLGVFALVMLVAALLRTPARHGPPTPRGDDHARLPEGGGCR